MKKRAPREVIDANEVDIVGPRLGQLVLRALKILHVLQTENQALQILFFLERLKAPCIWGDLRAAKFLDCCPRL